MNNSFLPISSFSISKDHQDEEWVLDAVRNGWGEARNKYIDILQNDLGRMTGNEFCLAVSHGTDAIQLAISALKLNAGDEIIVPDLTWVACAAPILHSGLKPVFVNVDATMCISPESFRNAITPKTKAVLVVDLAGSLPKWDEIIKISRDANLFVIEDAAESLGSFYKGKPAGGFGDISILSFSGTKVITGGQGGAILTNNKSLFDEIKLLFHHGIDQTKTGKYYWSTKLGFNFQISNIQAAMIASQLTRIESLIEFKRKLFETYKSLLSHAPNIKLIEPSSEIRSSHWLLVATINKKLGISKEQVIAESKLNGIDIRPFFYLLSEMPPFMDCEVENNIDRDGTLDLSRFGICLPYGYDMNASRAKIVIEVLKGVIEKYDTPKPV